MILTIKNQVSGIRSYLGGLITVADGGQTTISREFNTILIGDAQFLSDLGSNGPINIILNNGVKDLNSGEALTLAQALAAFSTDPVATIPLYYSAPVAINQSAGTAANATVWAMRNATSQPIMVVIERINLLLGFDAGTPLGRQTIGYSLCRFSTATPTGGTSITPSKATTLSGSTVVTDIRFLDTGLTTTSVVFDNPFTTILLPAVSGSTNKFDAGRFALKLEAGEGLAIRLAATAVAGLSLSGHIVWSHR